MPRDLVVLGCRTALGLSPLLRGSVCNCLSRDAFANFAAMTHPGRGRIVAALVAVMLPACTSFRTIVREECPPLFGRRCRDAYAEYFSEDPAAARTAYRAHVQRIAASCESLRASASSGGEAPRAEASAELPSESPDPVSDQPSGAWTDGPGSPGMRDRCTVVAALRARATQSNVLREYGVPAESDPEALPADWDGAIAMLRAICASDSAHRSCVMLATMASAERGGQDREYWFRGPVAGALAESLLDRRERLPLDDATGRQALLQRAERLYVDNDFTTHLTPAPPWLVRLSQRLASIRAEGASDDAQRVAAELDAAVDAEGFDPTDAASRVLISRVVRAAETVNQEHRGALMSRVAATAQRAAERILRDATARQTHLSALDALAGLHDIATPEAEARWLSALRAEGGRLHVELAARHLSANRPGMAWFHTRLARVFDAPVDSAAETALAGLYPVPFIVAQVDAAGCPWAAPEPVTPPAGRAVATVELRWTNCESNERRWQTSEARTVTEHVERSRPVQRQVLVGAVRCGALERFCTPQSGRWETVTETFSERVPVERSVNVRVDHRELRSIASASATFRREGRSFSDLWQGYAPTLEETQSFGRAHFSATTLDEQRRTLRASLAAWLGEGGGAQVAIARDAARELSRQAGQAAASDPEAADELYARALFIGGGNAAPEAADHLAARHRVPAGRMRTTFAR